jgi:hypothetical protein
LTNWRDQEKADFLKIRNADQTEQKSGNRPHSFDSTRIVSPNIKRVKITQTNAPGSGVGWIVPQHSG